MAYGVSHHVRGVHTGGDIAALGSACAVLGTNHRWTTFVIVGDAEFDLASMARELESAVVQIASSDDDGWGRVMRFHGPDGWEAELNALPGEGDEPSPEDRKLLDELVRRDILTDAQRSALEAGLGQEATKRASWMLMSGIEQVLGVPNALLLPWGCPADLLTEIVEGVEVIAARPAKRTRTTATMRRAPVPSPAAPPSIVDRAVLALHVGYWMGVFQMNCWTLYHKYKRHLPAERRREVDELVDQQAGSHWAPPRADVERAVEAILATVWHAEDWDAAVRDPSLLTYEPLTQEEIAAWQRLLEVRPQS